jgi:cyclic beta-1,2-glucan synthetase
VLTRNTLGPSALWRYGISGDIPIVLVRIDDAEDREIVRQLLRAHEYWRMKQLAVDLVIMNEQASSYAQDLQTALETQVRVSQSRLHHDGHDPHGNVFILRAEDEVVSFLDGPILAQGQDESYFQPQTSEQRGTLFEHCARALDHSLAVGSHGLPLIGSGDWNDGMNRVGHEGKGESVWLGWFLHTILWEFARLADTREERQRAEVWRLHVSALKAALEREAWDGAWYRRAFFDDGTPLGSATNTACRIDAIAQSWGVISGAAEPARATRAMAAVSEQLVRDSEGLALLFTPPFDDIGKILADPGYIKGYPPGIRENGGQYTHAAIWSIIAFAALGEGEKAYELFKLVNPILHGNTRFGIHRYKVEPYVVAADVYAEPPHVGRGGWTWYTGAAG